MALRRAKRGDVAVDAGLLERAGECGELAMARGSRASGRGTREPGHQRRRDMGRDLQTDQVVRDQAVEQGEQAVLRGRAERRLQAEHRVSRDRAGRQHRGDQGDAVRRARDVAIGEPAAAERRARRRAVSRPRRARRRRRSASRTILKRGEMLALDDRQVRGLGCARWRLTRSTLDEVRAIFGGVQLPSESTPPTRSRRPGAASTPPLRDDLQIDGRAQERNRQMLRIARFEQRSCDRDRPRRWRIVGRRIRQRVEPGRVGDGRTRRSAARFVPTRVPVSSRNLVSR